MLADKIICWRSECLAKKAFLADLPSNPDTKDTMPDYLPDGTVHLNLSKWWNWLSESELSRLKSMNCPISLSLEGFEKIPQQTFDMVGKYLSNNIVELGIASCPDLTWTGEIKALLRSCAKMVSLRLVSVPWIDDGMIEQLSVRYHKSLRSIHLENCALTNNSIFQIGRRCNQLQVLTLVCCTRISDTGLLELTKNINLSYIHIAHNYNITDKSLAALLGAAKNLRFLNLANCAKLTDQTISALYETTAAWGKKRNLAGSVLRYVNLQSNSHFTAQVLLWLSTSATVMQSIDITECASLDITKGMKELFNLTDLRTLILGPTSIPVKGADFSEYLQCHADNLTTLHLNGLAGVNDDTMGQILDYLLNLQNLILQDVPFGTAMTESLCSSIPNISKLHLIGSDSFGDAELRCIASVCLHIKDLTISRCNRLTDSGFVRLIGLKFIKHLSLAYCSRNCTGSIVKLLGVCPLLSLSLDGHRLNAQDVLSFLRKEARIELTKLSLQQVVGLTLSDVKYILENFVGLQSLDLTNAHNLSPDHLMVLSHCNPFLTYSFSSDYSGFVLSSVNSRKFGQYWTMFDQLSRHYGARLMQRLRRKYLKRLDQLKELRKEKYGAFKISRIVLIQAMYRSHKARRETRKKLLAGRRIVRAGKDWLFYSAYLKELRAKNQYRRHLKCSLYGILLKHHVILQKRIKYANKVLVEHHNARMLKKYFKLLLRLRLVMHEIKFEYSALAFWEMNFMAKVVRCWKSVIFSSSKHNQTLTSQFLICLPLATWNSSRQIHKLTLAENFRNQKLLCIAWVVLAKDRLEKKRVDSLMPMAIEHFNKSFYKRLCGSINKAWSRYAKNRMFKRDKKRFGDYMYKIIRFRRGCVGLDMNFLRIQFLKNRYKLAPPHFNAFTSRLMLTTRFVPLVKNAVVYRKIAKKADDYIKQRRVCKGYVTFMKGAIRMRMWRVMNKKAESASKIHYYRLTYNAWKEFRIYCHNLEALYVKRYLAKLKKKMFRLFQMAVKISKEIARQLALEIEQKAQSEEAFRRAINSLRRFQAKVRGYVVRKYFLEERVQKLYSIQVLQNFFRTYFARKEYASRLKKKDLEEKIREDKERDIMQQEDLDMVYFLYHDKAATDMQRAYRGMRGRRVAYDLAVEYYRKKLLDFQKGNQHTRLHHQAYLRAAYLREQQRHVAATDIERIARGKLCRLRFVKIKRHALMEKKAVIVQRWYRSHLAHVRLLAMRRDRYNEIRFREGKKRRGLILRIMGAKKRSKQRPLSKALQELGLDPISYNHRLDELWEETKKDWHNFIDVLKRERALFKEHGLNKLNRMLERRKLLADNGWKLKTQQAVKIVERGHPYEGCTGVIVRIDDTVQGNPLYEVNLDKVNKQTFVRMTTDPLKIYETMQPLAAIDNYPSLPLLTAATEIFGLKGDDPYFSKKNINAAWTIQRAYRMHRARQIAGQKRYEHWKQCISRQHSLLLHLSDSNALNTQGFNFAHLLNIRSFRPIKFDEIRHKLKPARLSNVIAKASERSVINKEIDLKLKDRMKFLQKSALKQSKDFFATGYDQLSSRKKLGNFLSSIYGLFYRKKELSVPGVQGLKQLAGKQTSISGTDRYTFKQFHASPHVRYYKTSLYQGEWSGIPFVTSLRPHGEGLIMFLDGWGYAKEDKVLYLTIIACRHLNPADIATGAADPYCEIKCNGMQLQTSIKWTNLNPKWHENFELDVTNPSAKLNIVVKDKDYFGSDDFMGQIELKLSEFSDGKTYHATYQLKGEVLTQQDDDEDRGEIEIRLRWAERKDDDDNLRQQIKLLKLVRLQAWARGMSAVSLLNRLRVEQEHNLEIVRLAAIKITSVCRQRLAFKEFRRRARQKRAAIKIQKRVRIWIAKKIYRRLKIKTKMAIIIQARMRVCLAKAYVIRLKAKNAADLNATVTVIQKYARRMFAYRLIKIMRKDEALRRKLEGTAAGSSEESPVVEPVSSWLPTYGVDPEYRLKRNRRITQRLFKRMLQLKYIKFVTRFGLVYLDSYPPRRTEEEILLEISEGTANKPESLTNRDDFMSAFIPPFDPVLVHRKEAIEAIAKHEHLGVLHIPTAVELRKSVDYVVTTIQCAQRQRVARAQFKKMLRAYRGMVLFQRLFRRRYEVYFKSAVMITSIFRMNFSKKRTAHIRRERNAAVTLQCSYRCYVARSMMFDFRSVAKLAVLKSSPSAEVNHGPEKSLEHRSDTFWIANSPDKAEIRIEFGQIENIVEVWIMTSTYSSSPNFVTIAAVLNKKAGYTELVDRHELPLLKERRWHKFVVPITSTKYFMLVFQSNYGDDQHIAVRQIRFIKSKESSATIVKQPVNYILSPGPSVAERAEVILRITATGWPLPSFQWYRNGKIIEGATGTELKLSLFCPVHGGRVYRCVRCKMVSKSVPLNAYHIQCGNCSYLFTYKEVEDFDKMVVKMKVEEETLNKAKSSLQASKIQMESLISNAKFAQLLADATERLRIVEEQLQELRERRVKLKQSGMPVNNFTDEGVYVCEVSNVRGGSLKIKRKSVGAVVLVEKPKPFIVDVVPLYVPRKQASRKKWTIYSSIIGTFRHGTLEGLVRIRYNDNSFYEGPYIDEDCVDYMGQSLANVRKSNHFGIFRLADGRTFEGHNVDNHFDVSNLQTYYRVKFPNNEVYEGMFVDETFHGVGLYKYSDGSVYEGQWHRGSRFGHGQLRSAEGWNYEGFFDTNRRHRKGMIDFPDGSSYMGDWYYDKITGYGIYITALKDVYRGQVLDGRFHGQGHILYADGSTFTGMFKDGFRHGKGIFIEKEGTEYYGHFHNDMYHGEMVVKIIIPIEEQGQDNYEIRVGLYEMGKLVKWKSKFSNPIATKQFVHLFKTNRDMFDSVYSMLLAKHLPHLPEGIDANNKKVKNIIFRIRLEAGMLVGQDALNQAKRNIENILIPYNRKKDEVDAIKKQMQDVSTNMITIERESQHLHAKYSHFMSRYEKSTSKVEQFWQDDPKQIRLNFYKACRDLYNFSTDDFFAFRNFRVVPVFVKKIVDAISYLLSMPDAWKDQVMLLSDSSSNGRAGDEEALRLSYHCKLAYWMTYGPSTGASVNAAITSDASATGKKEVYDPNRNLAKLKKKTLKYFEDDDESKIGLGYNVFDYINMKEPEKLAAILADTRFRSDSYYIESTGVVGPILVNWVKANFAYLTAAKTMHDIMHIAEEDKAAAFRFKAQYTKKQDELSEQIALLNSLQHQTELCNEELEELQHSLVKAKDLLQFIAGRYQFEQNDSKADYYKLLEQKLEEKRDFFNVEVCVQSIVDKVVERHDREKYIKRIQAFGSGQPYVDEDEINLKQYLIVDWIREEVLAQQRSILESGRTLGYGFEPEATDVTQAYTMQLISLIADIAIGKMNDRYNDLAAARSWISRKGQKIPCRFVYIYSWKIWESEAIGLRNSLAIAAWEKIFGDKVSCARAAVEAKVNNRMSSIARAQGKVWAEHHKQDIAYAESDLAAEFLSMYENVKEASNAALMIEQQTTIVDGQLYYDESAITPTLRAQTMCFSKLYPDDMQAARDEYYVQYAQAFYDQYGLTSGTIAFQLLNGLPTQNGEDDLPYMEYAQHWRDFNLEAYEQAGEILMQEMCSEFAELYPLNTPMEAARMIVNERLHVYLQDEALLAAYTPNPKHMIHAYCYAMRNQGLVRASKETLHKNYQSECNKFWQELLNQTAQFQKGSALSVSNGEEDRFIGFRDRLLSKYGFVYAFLSYRYDVLSKEIAELRLVDPLEKVIHRVRPSQMRDVLYSREHNFLQQKFELEDELNEAIAKLSTWNSYFGWVQSS